MTTPQVKIVEMGDDRHGLIRAMVPAPGVTGQRQIGYALPVLDDDRKYLVRVPGHRAIRAVSRYHAIETLQRIGAL